MSIELRFKKTYLSLHIFRSFH